MAKKLYTESSIQDIADAIREKSGSTDKYNVSQMGNAIRDIYIPEIIDDGTQIAYGPDTEVDNKNKQYYEPDIKDISDAIREKNTSLDSYKVSEMSTAIRNIEQGAVLNVEYGQTPPADTSKLWVKCDKPTNVTVSSRLGDGAADVYGFPLIATLPSIVTGAAVAAVGKKVYVFGGASTYTNSNPLTTINVLDTETGSVTTLDAKAPSTPNCKAAAIGTKIYLACGGQYQYYRTTFHVFDTETNTIKSLATSADYMPSSFGMAAVGTKLYLFGGSANTSATKKITVFDTNTSSIVTLSSTLPIEMNNPICVTIGTKIYVFGPDNSSVEHVCVFDTNTNVCTDLNLTIPRSISSSAAIAAGTKVYIFGGGMVTTSSTPSDTILMFDSETNTFTTLDTRTPVGANGMGITLLDSKIYLVGGRYHFNSGCCYNSIYELPLTTPLAQGDVWIQTDMVSNFFPLISGETAIETGIYHVYVGNADNVMEEVEAYIYNGSKWVQI